MKARVRARVAHEAERSAKLALELRVVLVATPPWSQA